MGLLARLTAVLITVASVPSEALVYTGTRTVGANSATLSITTDGTLGDLSDANITDFFVTLTSPERTTAVSYADQPPQLSGSGLSATARHLSFDFAGDSILILVFNGRGAYCLDGAASGISCVGAKPSESILFLGASSGSSATASRTGSAIIASSAVPEPASWVLLVTGFGMVGAAMRRRKVATASA